MNHIPDTTTAEDGGNFDPRQAAAPRDHTTQALRELLSGRYTPGTADHEYPRT